MSIRQDKSIVDLTRYHPQVGRQYCWLQNWSKTWLEWKSRVILTIQHEVCMLDHRLLLRHGDLQRRNPYGRSMCHCSWKRQLFLNYQPPTTIMTRGSLRFCYYTLFSTAILFTKSYFHRLQYYYCYSQSTLGTQALKKMYLRHIMSAAWALSLILMRDDLDLLYADNNVSLTWFMERQLRVQFTTLQLTWK